MPFLFSTARRTLWGNGVIVTPVNCQEAVTRHGFLPLFSSFRSICCQEQGAPVAQSSELRNRCPDDIGGMGDVAGPEDGYDEVATEMAEAKVPQHMSSLSGPKGEDPPGRLDPVLERVSRAPRLSPGKVVPGPALPRGASRAGMGRQ